MRKDAIAFADWGDIRRFHEIIPPLSLVVSGPGFSNVRNASLMHDVFWIASRAAAASAFVGFSHSLAAHVDRKELYMFFKCAWPPKSGATNSLGALLATANVRAYSCTSAFAYWYGLVPASSACLLLVHEALSSSYVRTSAPVLAYWYNSTNTDE